MATCRCTNPTHNEHLGSACSALATESDSSRLRDASAGSAGNATRHQDEGADSRWRNRERASVNLCVRRDSAGPALPRYASSAGKGSGFWMMNVRRQSEQK